MIGSVDEMLWWRMAYQAPRIFAQGDGGFPEYLLGIGVSGQVIGQVIERAGTLIALARTKDRQ